MTVTLLGPQRCRTTVRGTVHALAPEGPVATVTAGWEEREPDDGELDALLDGRSINLGLYRRWLDVVERDPEFAAADRQRRDALDELRDIYAARLHFAMEALYAVHRRAGRAQVREAAYADALAAVQHLDAWHLELVAAIHAEFDAAWPVHDRRVVAEHRAAVAEALARTSVLVITGGHVGVLLSCLRLFGVDASPERHIVAWSAGAMVTAERIVLFHDKAAQGFSHAEVYDVGLRCCAGVVPLPHAKRRLLLDDHERMAVFAHRFAPARCIVLDEGSRLACGPDGVSAGSARVLTSEGRVTALEPAA